MRPGPGGQSTWSSRPSAAAAQPAAAAAAARTAPATPTPATPFTVSTPPALCAIAPFGLSTRDIATPEAASSVFVAGITNDVTVRDPAARVAEMVVSAASRRSTADSVAATVPTARLTRIAPAACRDLLTVL